MNWTTYYAADYRPLGAHGVGLRGIYTIESRPTMHVLTGVGHDELSMPGLPLLGHGFGSVADAKTYVDWYDRQPAEAQASGGG